MPGPAKVGRVHDHGQPAFDRFGHGHLLDSEVTRAGRGLGAKGNQLILILVDKAAVACLRAALYTTLARADRGVEICVEYLSEAGVACSLRPRTRRSTQSTSVFWGSLAVGPLKRCSTCR